MIRTGRQTVVGSELETHVMRAARPPASWPARPGPARPGRLCRLTRTALAFPPEPGAPSWRAQVLAQSLFSRPDNWRRGSRPPCAKLAPERSVSQRSDLSAWAWARGRRRAATNRTRTQTSGPPKGSFFRMISVVIYFRRGACGITQARRAPRPRYSSCGPSTGRAGCTRPCQAAAGPAGARARRSWAASRARRPSSLP